MESTPGARELADGLAENPRASDIAALLGVSARQIGQWVQESKPGERLADHPFPTPARDADNKRYWPKEQVDKILDWHRAEVRLDELGDDPRYFRDLVVQHPDGREEEIRALTRSGVAAFLRVAEGSVSRWVKQSEPGGRRADDPFPPPERDIGGKPYWRQTQAEELLAWRSGDEPAEPGERTPVFEQRVFRLPDGTMSPPVTILTRDAVGDFLGFQPIQITRFMSRSRPGGDLEHHPFPAEQRDNRGNPYWLASQVDELAEWGEWYKSQPRRMGAGGGAGAHKRVFARYLPTRRAHAWHPPAHTTDSVTTRYCLFCEMGAVGKSRVDPCTGYSVERAARLSRVDAGDVRGRSGGDFIAAEVRDGLVQLKPRTAKIAVYELTAAGREWLDQYFEFAEDASV
ncbi:hypothetical protein I0C86_40600 [Plantactinospora sp. S1510]|uniref:Uncharacterized protein n=1 Tax=Plantactinospora alkalitolerans TaxID=2789879 RepID=A0ABS0HA99_9ACTN|nr:hypothetical protein [Plantactinospora alkalitolerans]MBF9135181.1 hypothetical protein [Plantactinospora alkalitolerans]